MYVNLAGDLEPMIQNIVEARQETGSRRIIAISSIGIYETTLRPVLIPYTKLADIIESSGSEYTILRPDWFTNVNEIDYALHRKARQKRVQLFHEKALRLLLRLLLKTRHYIKMKTWG